jgi:hypothetical protein
MVNILAANRSKRIVDGLSASVLFPRSGPILTIRPFGDREIITETFYLTEVSTMVELSKSGINRD